MIKNMLIFSFGFFLGTGLYLVVKAQELEPIILDQEITTVESPINTKTEKKELIDVELNKRKTSETLEKNKGKKFIDAINERIEKENEKNGY